MVNIFFKFWFCDQDNISENHQLHCYCSKSHLDVQRIVEMIGEASSDFRHAPFQLTISSARVSTAKARHWVFIRPRPLTKSLRSLWLGLYGFLSTTTPLSSGSATSTSSDLLLSSNDFLGRNSWEITLTEQKLNEVNFLLNSVSYM